MDSVDASCIPAYPLLGGARFYSASGALMKAQIRDTQEGSDDGSSGAIILSGIRFDEVDKMAAPWHPATDPSFETVKKWEEMALGEVPEHVSCPYNGLDGRKSALQKLCVAAAKKTEDKRRLLATSRPEFLRASSSKQNLTLPSPPNPEVYNVCAHRRLIATKRRHLGLAPATAEKGDVIAVLYGGKTPYLLRPVLTDSGAEPGSKKLMYRLMGEVYVAGIMEGEAMSWEHAGACMREFRIY
ncbi:hypothetical protein QBC44DRAFT_321424 [Cladorrhinum sp. PSN332]|nr:hypothetical protein QBC44DRAFT_321424 [Cladorrhinum sp. PSN332]